MTNTQANASAVRQALTGLSRPVFYASAETEAPLRVTIHAAGVHRRAFARDAEAAFARAGLPARCTVRALKSRKLERTPTLQAVADVFGGGSPIFDPTLSVGRVNAVLRCAQSLKTHLGGLLRASFIDPRTRTLYLLVQAGAAEGDGATDAKRRERIEALTAAAIDQWRYADRSAFDLKFRLCLRLPQIPLLPLGTSSCAKVAPRSAWRAWLKSGVFAGGIATLFGLNMAEPAHADPLPAVSAPNARVDLSGGLESTGPDSERSAGFATGSVTVPVGTIFGAQGDALYGLIDGQPAYVLGGQGFWRDPSQGLIGVFGDYVHSHLFNSHQGIFGAEGELYQGHFTLEGIAGYEAGRPLHGGLGRVDLSWYPTDDFKLSAGAQRQAQLTTGIVGAEYQLGFESLSGLSLFAEAGVSGSGLDHLTFGLRYYFAAPKTLIRRHREDDPILPISDWTTGTAPVSGYGAGH